MKSLKRDEEGALDELIARKSQGLLNVATRMLGDAEEARDHLRARQRRERAMSLAGSSLRAVDRDRRSLAELQHREVGEVLLRLIDCLSERQRAVFVLRAIEGFDTKEVAAIVGCRVSTVRNHLFVARRKLRRELEVCFPEYAPGSPIGPADEGRQ
jgi:DNA-directed RNA polymerase specialized sigma subunit